jgi:single-stranded-DNA-specific exonuclease
VGIVASRLVSRFGKPAIVLSVDGERAKGSGRSIGEVDLYELLRRSSEWLEGFGGHKMAAGLSLRMEHFDAFRRKICEEAAKLDPRLFEPPTDVMGVLPLSEIDWELMEILERFEPYGEANRRPKFLIKNISVIDSYAIGAEKNHLKLLLGDEKKVLSAIEFGFEKEVPKGRNIDVSGTLSINEFNGRRTIQLLVDRIETSGP